MITYAHTQTFLKSQSAATIHSKLQTKKSINTKQTNEIKSEKLKCFTNFTTNHQRNYSRQFNYIIQFVNECSSIILGLVYVFLCYFIFCGDVSTVIAYYVVPHFYIFTQFCVNRFVLIKPNVGVILQIFLKNGKYLRGKNKTSFINEKIQNEHFKH